MKRAQYELFAKRVIQYYECHGQKDTIHHFTQEGARRTSLYRIIKRFEETEEQNFKSLPGRPRVVSTPRNLNKVKRVFEQTPSISVRAVADKLRLSKSSVSRIKRHDLNMKAYAKLSAPKYIKDQEVRAKKGCRKVYAKTLKKILIIDDETYVPVDPSDVPGKQYFHSTTRDAVDYKQRVLPKAKFFNKYLVWQAIDQNGNISEPYICTGSMNSKVYLKECIIKRLIPFINKHHRQEDVVFWPDMATCHYASEVTQYLESTKIEYILKRNNAPNVPQARGIEMFWALCKKEYKKRTDKPKSLTAFKHRWTRLAKNVATKSGKAVMRRAAINLRKIGYKGVVGANLI